MLVKKALYGSVCLWVLLMTRGCHDCVHAAHYDDEASLRTAVLNNYNYKIRPDSKVNVDVRFSLLAINQLDVPSQRLSLSGWLTLRWNDSRLTWTPATYNGITDFYDTELVLWRPQVIVDNSVANLNILESDKLLLRVTSAGQLTWEPPGIFETYCDVDVTYYPFDSQTCRVEVTTWAYTQAEVDLLARDAELYLADYETSGEWDIVRSWTERRVLVDGQDLHSQIDFNMLLRRKPTYYVNAVVIPVIVTSLLSVIVFLLPAESGEKVGYSLTILLTYVVLLTLVAGYMPPTSKTTSVLSIYLTVILFVGVFFTLLSVVILYVHHQHKERPLPSFLCSLTKGWLIPLASWKPLGPNEAGENVKDRRDGRNNGFTKWSTNKSSNKIHSDVATHSENIEHESVVDWEAQTDDYHDVSRHSESIGHETVVGDKDVSTHSQNIGHKVVDRKRQIDDYHLKWQDVSDIFDIVCFRVLGSLVLLLTIVMMLVLVIGGLTQADA